MLNRSPAESAHAGDVPGHQRDVAGRADGGQRDGGGRAGHDAAQKVPARAAVRAGAARHHETTLAARLRTADATAGAVPGRHRAQGAAATAAAHLAALALQQHRERRRQGGHAAARCRQTERVAAAAVRPHAQNRDADRRRVAVAREQRHVHRHGETRQVRSQDFHESLVIEAPGVGRVLRC